MSTEKIDEKLRRLRQELGLPLRKVAAIIDVDVAILSKMERGERKLTKSIVEKLARLYHQDQDELMVLFLSQKIIDEVGEEDLVLKAMMVAEEAIEYKTNRPQIKETDVEKKELTKKIQQYFQTQSLVSKAWLFGSFARGDDSPASDIDILIDVPSSKKFTLFDLAEVQEQVKKIANRNVDVVMLKGLRSEMKNRINKDMQLIYEAG